MAKRMGLASLLAELIQSHTGRRAVKHLHAAAEAENKSQRRTHLRTAVRLARKALTRQRNDDETSRRQHPE